MVRAIKRLFPVYWFSLIFVLALQFYGRDSRLFDPDLTIKLEQLDIFFVNFSMLQSFVGVGDIDGAAWTLGVELNFYILIFALKKFFKRKYMFLILILLVFLELLFRIDRFALPGEFYFNTYLLGNHLSLFVSGILIYEIHYNNSNSKINYFMLMFVFLVQFIQYFKSSDNGGIILLLILLLFT